MTEKSPYLNASEMTALLRICERSLYTYVQERRVPPPIWLGGKRLWVAQTVHDSLGAARNLKRRRRR
jgi:predicted DNA-binding transcriptional regulator AlpA